MWCAITLHFSLTHPPVDDSLSVQEKQTHSNLCSIKPAEPEMRKINILHHLFLGQESNSAEIKKNYILS